MHRLSTPGQPAIDAHVAQRRRLTSLLLGLASGVLYVSTLFPGVGGIANHGDSAKFQFLGVVPGVGHPPGNPLYLLVLGAVQALPWGEPALRANLLSAACAALAVWLTADAVYRVAGMRAACVSAACLALGGMFWEFGTEAEVYALAAAFVAFEMYALTRAELERNGFWMGAALAGFLLGLAHHLSLIFAAPGLAWALMALWRRGLRPSRASLGLALACALATLALYAALPLLHAHSAYSEYRVAPDLRGWFEFVSAAKFRPHLNIPSLADAFVARPQRLLGTMAKQWTLALWAGAPLAAYALARRLPATGMCFAVSALAWLAFTYAYDVPDPEGFLVPVAVALAPALGIAVESVRRPVIPALLIALCLAFGLVEHARVMRARVGFDIVEDLGLGERARHLDLPDIIARMPPGSLLAAPCTHYGCTQVANYYRFADRAARARAIEVISIEGGLSGQWASSPPAVRPELGRRRVLCTIQPAERDLLMGYGVIVRTLQRGSARVRGHDQERVPLYCSVPARAGG